VTLESGIAWALVLSLMIPHRVWLWKPFVGYKLIDICTLFSNSGRHRARQGGRTRAGAITVST